jgi:hypothetical protein
MNRKIDHTKIEPLSSAYTDACSASLLVMRVMHTAPHMAYFAPLYLYKHITSHV